MVSKKHLELFKKEYQDDSGKIKKKLLDFEQKHSHKQDFHQSNVKNDLNGMLRVMKMRIDCLEHKLNTTETLSPIVLDKKLKINLLAWLHLVTEQTPAVNRTIPE